VCTRFGRGRSHGTGPSGVTKRDRICTSSGLLATNPPLLPCRLQLPVALRVELPKAGYYGRRPKQPTTTFSSLDYSSATHDPNTSAWSQKATQQTASTTTRRLKPSPFQSCLWFRSLLLVRHRFFFLVWRRVRATLGMRCRCCREQSGVASFYDQSLARLSQASRTVLYNARLTMALYTERAKL
jgi:hypothetical protein